MTTQLKLIKLSNTEINIEALIKASNKLSKLVDVANAVEDTISAVVINISRAIKDDAKRNEFRNTFADLKTSFINTYKALRLEEESLYAATMSAEKAFKEEK